MAELTKKYSQTIICELVISQFWMNNQAVLRSKRAFPIRN